MKKSLLMAAVAVALISASAIAQSVGEKAGVNSVLGVSPTTQDFVKEAATRNRRVVLVSQGSVSQGETNGWTV
jgi:putative membrane protein